MNGRHFHSALRAREKNVAVQTALVFSVWLSLAPVAFGFDADVVTEIRPDFLMDSDPRLELPQPKLVFPQRCKSLWLESLARPEADLQRLSASAIAQAHPRGMSGLIEAVPLLVKIVTADETHRATRFAAARALIVLEARTSVMALFEASQRYEGDLRQLVEPVLAQWNFLPIRKIWHDRLAAQSPRHRDLLLAIRGLGTVGDAAAAERLLAIVHDPLQLPPTRIAAARSAGRISEAGLEQQAVRLLDSASPSVDDRLRALALVDRHRSHDAQALLLRLAQDAEPGVAASALRRLNEINSDLVLPLAEKAIGNDDPHVREQGIDAYFARPSPQRAVFIVQLLDDPHPAVRGKVCGQLFRMAQIPEYNAPIREAAMALLTNASWRGQQQSALLLASLDHKPAASAMLALLESPRGEVMVAAAWGLRKLAVADTLPAMLDKAVRQTEVRKSSQWGIELDLQVAHLLEAMGIQKYAPAEPLLRKYIRKDYSMGDYSRGAAIWSLGQLFAGKQDRALSTQLVERLIDPIPPRPLEPPEIMRVRVMSAVTLGRMGAVEQLPLMRQYLGPKVTPVPSSLAIRWAVKELTGESLPQPEPEQVLQSWFLEPLDDNERGD